MLQAFQTHALISMTSSASLLRKITGMCGHQGEVRLCLSPATWRRAGSLVKPIESEGYGTTQTALERTDPEPIIRESLLVPSKERQTRKHVIS